MSESDLHDPLALTCDHPEGCRTTTSDGAIFCRWCEDVAIAQAAFGAVSDLIQALAALETTRRRR